MSRAAADALAAVFGMKLASVEVILPVQTVSEANRRDHWAVKAKRVKRHRLVARALCPAMGLPCVVRLTRLSPGTLDDDNLRGALKAVRDGVADRLGVDDRDPRVTWEYAQERSKGLKGVVRLELRPRAEPEDT